MASSNQKANKASILTPDPLRVQSATTIQPSIPQSERALGQAEEDSTFCSEMPAIGQLGTVVRVTPSDDVQIVRSNRDQDFTFIDDRSPFFVRVDGIIEDGGEIIGVHGRVVSGHERYLNQTGTLLVRLDNANWRRDNRSAAQFKVGQSVATPNGKHPFYHPEGTDIAGFPFIIRYGSLDSRGEDEAEINFAKNPPETTQAESGRDGRISPATPPTPPGMRVRTGRFQSDSGTGP